MVAKALL